MFFNRTLAVYRLRSLNFISTQECDQLVARYQDGKKCITSLNMLSHLESKEDKTLSDRELRSELSYLAVEAFRRQEISRGRLIELGDIIGIGGKDLYDFALATLDQSRDEQPCEVYGVKEEKKCQTPQR